MSKRTVSLTPGERHEVLRPQIPGLPSNKITNTPISLRYPRSHTLTFLVTYSGRLLAHTAKQTTAASSITPQCKHYGGVDFAIHNSTHLEVFKNPNTKISFACSPALSQKQRNTYIGLHQQTKGGSQRYMKGGMLFGWPPCCD